MKLRHLLLPALSILFLPACDEDTNAGADGGLDAAASTGGSDGGTSDVSVPDGGAAEVPPVVTADCATLTATTMLDRTTKFAPEQVLRGVIAVNGAVQVTESKLTIEAGTTFLMAADSSIEFGWNQSIVSVFARGTATAPIRFCGRTATPGFWNNVVVGRKVTSDSVLENVVISGAGQKTGAALELEAPVLLKNVVVSGSGADGVQAEAFKEGSTGLTVSGAAKAPVVLTSPRAATTFPLPASFTTNANNVIALRFPRIDLEDGDVTFKNAGIPYLQEESVSVNGAVKLTFEAGVDYRLAVDTSLDIGWNSAAATVIANGTMAAPVVFGRASMTAGQWKSIIINTKVKSDSVLNYVTIGGGGNGDAETFAFDVKAPITMKNVTLDGNKTGMRLAGTGLGPTSTALTITRTMGPPATADLGNAMTLPKTGSAYTGNTSDWVVIDDGDFTGVGTLPNLGVPFRIEGKPQTRGTSQLTIEPGTTFLMGADSLFEIGWNSSASKITAVGTAAAPIVFKGVEDTVGYWEGLRIGTMVAASSKLSYVQIANGGKATGGALELLKMGVDVTFSKFSKSAGYGILKYLGDPMDYAAAGTGNTFEMNTLGPVGPLP